MDQGVTSPKATISGRTSAGQVWQSIVAKFWAAIMVVGQQCAQSFRRFRNSGDSVISPTLNVDGISTRLAVLHRAGVDGRSELPPSSEQAVTGTQREIIAYFRGLQRDALKEAANAADRLRQLSDQIDVAEAVSDIRDIPSKCEREIVRLTLDVQSELISAHESESLERRRYEVFRDGNDHHRQAPRFASAGIRVFLMATIIISGVLAFSMSASVGQEGIRLYPTPWIYGVFFSVVLISFWLGRRAFPQINDNGDQDWAVGWLGAMTGIAVSAALAFASAHYIDELGRNPQTNVLAVVQRILQAPTAVGLDPDKLTAPGIVILAGLLAFLLGYRSDDSYLQYGKVQLDYYRAREKRENLTKRLRMRINAIIDDAESDAVKSAKRLKSQVRKFSRMVDASKNVPASLMDFDVWLEDTCNILLDRYRAENRKFRKTKPPQSFSEHICFRTEELPNPVLFESWSKRQEEIIRGIAGIEDEVQNVRKELRELNWQAINAVDDPADHGNTRSES